MAASNGVYVGVWRNWDKGPWARTTITIPASYGAILVVVLAMYIRFCGDHLWRIGVFFIHQRRSTRDARDGLFHQEQVLLRNVRSPDEMLWSLVQIYSRWQQRVSRPWARFAVLALPTTIYLAAFAAAGLLSSQLLNLGDEVLAVGPTCGWLPDNITTLSAFVINQNETENLQDDSLYVEGRQIAERSLDYAFACYEQQVSAFSAACNTLVQAKVPTKQNLTAPCPFSSSSTCELGTAAAMDSGLLDSSRDLGLNTPSHQRIQVRKKTTCATTPFDKYMTGWTLTSQHNDTALDPTTLERASRYSWMGYDIFDGLDPFTVSIANDSALVVASSYGTSVYCAYDGTPNDTGIISYPFKAELQTPNADTVFLLLQNLAVYAGPVTDLFFKASSQTDLRDYPPNPAYALPNAWYPDRVLSTLGCAEQYQFCAGPDRCTALGGLYTMAANSSAINALNFNVGQNAVYGVVWKALWSAQAAFQIDFLKDRTLQAERFRRDFAVSAPVNADQWIRETSNVHNMSMAVLQRHVVDYAVPPNIQIRPNIGTQDFIIPPTRESEKSLCDNVKIRSPGHASFSLISLLIVLFIGGLIVAANMALADFVFWLRHRRQQKAGRRLGAKLNTDFDDMDRTQAWVEGHTFQLQRAVLESRGIGPWDAEISNVPVLLDGQKRFGVLDTLSPIDWKSDDGKPQPY